MPFKHQRILRPMAADSEAHDRTPDPPRPLDAPNVVFIVLDDVGFSHLGCYGSDIRTPHIDSLAFGGIRYSNFHTTPMCSPTRASLLTGRNHHAVGMGGIADWSSDFDNASGCISMEAATLAEILRDHKYNTIAVGKWHVDSPTHDSPAGPYDGWPLGRGFERYYGFLGALTDQFNPDLVEDNHRVAPPEGGRPEGYHLTEDLVDRSITYLREQQSGSAPHPFFLYLALGACHSPLQSPREYIDSYRGHYDEGWDAVREQWFRRQLDLGIVPPGTILAERNAEVPAWDSLSDAEKRVYARMQETFAGFLEHTDTQVGRLLSALDDLNLTENTMVVLLSDNGAAVEGGRHGTDSNLKQQNAVADTPEYLETRLDLLGTASTSSHYPQGWSMVGNTPLRLWKRYTHGGGVRDPLIVRWPARLGNTAGSISHQFHHVTDVMPTVLDCLALDAPQIYRGVPQVPVHGISMAYTFDDVTAPTRKRVQYFELLGHRALWLDGWKAVSRHQAGTPVEVETWELYDLENDFSEVIDVAAVHPERLATMQSMWWAEAGRYGVLPMDDRGWLRDYDAAKAESYVFHSGIAPVNTRIGPQICGRSHVIRARINKHRDDDEGVLIALGGRFGGYSLYLRAGTLVYCYNNFGEEQVVRSRQVLPTGAVEFGMRFDCDGRPGSTGGIVRLLADGVEVGCGEVPCTIPYYLGPEPIDIGRDTQTPVSKSYECPFGYTGDLDRVLVDILAKN